MSLRELQSALVDMVLTRGSLGTLPGERTGGGDLDAFGLGEEERCWLARVDESPGFDLTCTIQRWWRRMRLEQTTPLTLAALAGTGHDTLVAEHFRTTRCSTLFFVPEALAFLDWLVRRSPEPVVTAIASFERALLLASEAEDAPPAQRPAAPLVPGQRLVRGPCAALVAFPAPPLAVLAALVQRSTPPTPTREAFPVLVSPGLPALWRPATPGEQAHWARCRDGARLRDLLAGDGRRRGSLRALLVAGALVREEIGRDPPDRAAAPR